MNTFKVLPHYRSRSFSKRVNFYLRPPLEEMCIRDRVRGGITLGINMGQRIGIDINADFGTYKTPTATVFNRPDWYSYFYVDGTVFLSSGIQIFSGLSLYGLGGGFYHHMEMTSSLPPSTAVASGGSTGRPSGVRYRPNFSNCLLYTSRCV